MSNHDQDYSLAYLDSCDNIPLLMIHGFPFNSHMWEIQIEDLRDMARIIAPDLRGHGQTDPTEPPYSVAMLAEDCDNLLALLGIDEPVVICGLSMGGYVAFELYRRYPERVAGLILASTRAAADTAEGRAGRERTAAAVQERGVSVLVEGMLPKLLAPASYEAQPELVEFVQEMMAGTSVQGAVGALMAMRDRPDSGQTLAEIQVPCLIIHGTEDAIIPLAEAQAMQRAIPGAELVVIPDAGHLPNLEQPDRFSDAVADFLQQFDLVDDA